MEKYNDIGLVIFDFDGTIVRLNVDWKSLKRELSEYFKEVHSFESDFVSLYQEIDRINDLLGREAREEALVIIEKYELAGIKNFEYIPQALNLIKSLRNKGVNLAIFSSNTRKIVEAILSEIDKLDSFRSIITIEDISKNKPHPEGLHKILRACKVSKNKALFIGDRQRDLEAGKKAGVRTLCMRDLIEA